MRHTALLLLALLVTPAATAADDARIAEIRQLYADAGQPGDACDGNPCETSVEFSRVLPGTGTQKTSIRFTYVEHRETEEHVYPTYHLRKAVVRYNIAAQAYYVEYLFEGLQPALAFHLQTDALVERRTYFEGERVVRIDVRPTADGEGQHTVRDTGFSDEEQQHARSVRSRAQAVVRLFDAVVSGADAEMGGWPDDLPMP